MATHINGESEFRTLPLSERKVLTIRPTLNQARISAVSKPTAVFLGCFQGYSMPIWNETTNVEEELYYRFKVPERWDGISDPIINGYNYITGVEDVGDTFKFTFDYNCVDCMNGVLTDSVYSVDDEATIATGRTAQYTPYCLQASIPAATVQESGIFAGRVRRVESTGTEVDNEVAVIYISIEFPVDKIYAPWDY